MSDIDEKQLVVPAQNMASPAENQLHIRVLDYPMDSHTCPVSSFGFSKT
jgi:hypothetical protein